MGKVIKDFEPQILKILEFLDSSAENLPPRESEEPLKPFSDPGLESVTAGEGGPGPRSVLRLQPKRTRLRTSKVSKNVCRCFV